MDKDKVKLLTPNEFSFILIGAITGIGIFSTPNGIVKYSQQDAWISECLGGAYPLYMVLIGIFVSRRFPKENILVLSKKYFGKYIGSILNFGFLLFFLFI